MRGCQLVSILDQIEGTVQHESGLKTNPVRLISYHMSLEHHQRTFSLPVLNTRKNFARLNVRKPLAM